MTVKKAVMAPEEIQSVNNDPEHLRRQAWGLEMQAQREQQAENMRQALAEQQAQERQRIAADRFQNPEKYRQLDAQGEALAKVQATARKAEKRVADGLNDPGTARGQRDIALGTRDALRAKASMLAQLGGLADANGAQR